jgi:long-chain fatty acid transport protein
MRPLSALFPTTRTPPLLAAGLGVLLGLLAAVPGRAAGFSATAPPGIKAMGMAGAYTAQADDPTAIFYNPGGVALMKKKVSVGLSTVWRNELQFQGLPPGGASGTATEQEEGFDFPAFGYAVKPFGAKLKLGIGVYSPFALTSEWADPGAFAGRFAATRSELSTIDVNTQLAWKGGESFGFGAGVIYRSSKLSMGRRITGFDIDTGAPVDVASLALETDYGDGLGWNAGFLHKIGEGFAWGLVYRSEIEVDYTGAGSLTQIPTGNPQLDALTERTYPLGTDIPLLTDVTFPDEATLGIALSPTKSFLLEVDVTQTGWSRFEGVTIFFPTTPLLDDTVLRPTWDDALAYRLGLRFSLPKNMQLRLGYAFEESPMPDTDAGPFLPDADRNVFTLGFGRDWLDLAIQFIAPENRIVRTNADLVNGAYSGNSYVVGFSVTK